MLAAQFMTVDVVTLRPGTSVKAAAATLVDRNVASAPVVDDAGRLVGMLSELDLLLHDVPSDPLAHLSPVEQEAAAPPRTVAEVMTRDVIGLPPTADAAEFLAHMATDRIVCLPVVEDGRLVGVVSRRDLLRLLARSDADIAADIKAKLAEALPGAGWRAAVSDGVAELTAAAPAGQQHVAVRVALSVPGVVRVHLAPAAG
jgi:CBS domain-containing protein